MAIRDKMRANAASVLQPGENIQEVIAAQSANPYWAFLSYWILLFKSAYRVVVVTDEHDFGDGMPHGRRCRRVVGRQIVAQPPRARSAGPQTILNRDAPRRGEDRLERMKRKATEPVSG